MGRTFHLTIAITVHVNAMMGELCILLVLFPDWGGRNWYNIPTSIIFLLGNLYFHTFQMAFLTLVSSGLKVALLVGALKWGVSNTYMEYGSESGNVSELSSQI